MRARGFWHSGVDSANFCAIIEGRKGENRYGIKTIKRQSGGGS